MEKMTVTEALSEVNLIKKKIKSKQEKIRGALFRVEHVKDPFESDGGSEKMIQSEHQSLSDLNRRLEKIRSGISRANLETTITLGEEEKTIHDWLIWKREIATDYTTFVKDICNVVKVNNDAQAKNPQVYKDDEGKIHLVKPITNVDYSEWLKRHEKLIEKYENLDGKLSLKNATILIQI